MQKSSFSSSAPSKLRRFCARLIDYCLFYVFIEVFSLMLPLEIKEYFYFIFAIVAPLLWIPVEAILLSTWGTTIGKMLFQMVVRGKGKEKLKFKDAFKRACFLSPRPGKITTYRFSILQALFTYVLTIGIIGFSLLSKPIMDFSIGMEKQQTTEGWVQYFSEEAGFRVNFPNNPELESKEVELPSTNRSVNYSEYKSQQDKHVTYSVSYIELPRKWGFVSSKRILKGVLDVLLKLEPDAQLLEKEFAMHKNNYSALDFHLKKGEEEVAGRLIRVGYRLFKLTVIYPPSVADKLLNHEFIESFDLEKK
jgi:hypothetical protein